MLDDRLPTRVFGHVVETRIVLQQIFFRHRQFLRSMTPKRSKLVDIRVTGALATLSTPAMKACVSADNWS